MNKIFFVALVLLINNVVYSQLFMTGNVEFDANLTIINNDAKSNLVDFNSQLKLEFGVTAKKLEYMSANLKMQPAEIYLALEVSKCSKQPVDNVLVVYSKHKGKGWGVVAKECGIKPGSPEFHKLKGSSDGKAKKAKGGHSKPDHGGKGKSDHGKGDKKKH